MAIKLLLSLLLIISAISANSQITFQKIFGVNTYCPYVSANADGTFICTIDTEGTANYKIDGYGNVDWRKEVSLNGNVIPASIIEDLYGGYIFSGTLRDTTGPLDSKGLIVRLDANGDTISYRTFPPISDGNNGMVAIPTLDSNYLFDVYEAGPLLSSTSTLYKLDVGYNILWSVSSGASGTGTSGVLQDRDSNFVFTYYDPQSMTDIHVLKNNNQGVPIINKQITDTSTCSCFYSKCLLELKGSGYIVGAELQQKTLLIKLDSNLDTVWTKQLLWANNTPVSLAHDRNDGGYLLINYRGKACMYHFNVNGDSIAIYYFSPMITTVGSHMQRSPDGGYIISGTTYEYNNAPHGFIIKLDSLCRYTPQGHITASGPLMFCQGDSITLTGPNGNYDYEWSTGDTLQAITILSTGNYYLTITASTGNSSTLNPVNVFVSNQSNPQIINHIYYLEATTIGDYQWYRNGVAIAGATHDTLHTTQTGNFNVVVIDTVGCIRISSLFYYSWTGLEEDINNSFSFYPNPASTEISVHGNFINNSVTIFDVSSKVIRKIENINAENFYIDISSLQEGIYFLKFDKGEVEKFVVIR